MTCSVKPDDREIGKFRADHLLGAAKRIEAKAGLLMAEAARYRELADSINARLGAHDEPRDEPTCPHGHPLHQDCFSCAESTP